MVCWKSLFCFKILKISSGDISEELIKGNYLFLESYQRFISDFINPNTEYRSILFSWQPGSGKTIAAYAAALQFLDVIAEQIIWKKGKTKIIGLKKLHGVN